MMLITSWLFAVTLDDVAAAHGKMQTLRCAFVAEKKSKVFRKPVTNRGVVTVARGGKLRLETVEGERKTMLLVSDDSVRHVRDGRVEETQPLASLGRAKAFIMAFGNGLFGDLEGLRSAGWAAHAKPRGAALDVELVPTSEASTITRVALTFEADAGISRLLLVEASGDETSYRLSDCTRNTAVDTRVFTTP